MTSSELSLALHSMLADDGETENSGSILAQIFEKCMLVYHLIEESSLSSNSEQLQDAVNRCIKSLEKCTVMVNELDLFSSNEGIEELQTSSLRYLLLPVLLAKLNLTLQSKEMSERLKNIQISEIYFKDFLLRLKNYGLCEGKCFPDSDDEMLQDVEDSRKKDPALSGVSNLVAERERKIERYKHKKELQKKEEQLKSALGRPDADEYIREYYMVLLERWILTALEELENIEREKNILGTMACKQGDKINNVDKSGVLEVKPLKPIIITKNEIQKKVFGMGYPSLPIMTIDDFYRQRFEKLIQEQKSAATRISLQDKAFFGDIAPKEAEEIEKEELLEKDEPVALMKARKWDDWKDENPRGSGNRKNKG